MLAHMYKFSAHLPIRKAAQGKHMVHLRRDLQSMFQLVVSVQVGQ